MSHRRRRKIVGAGALFVAGIGAAVWALTSQGSDYQLKASDTCNEGVFSDNLEPLERLLSPDPSFQSNWSRVATDGSFKIVCDNSTSRGTVKMVAEMKDGKQEDWISQLGSKRVSDASIFKVGTSAFVWDSQAVIYVECKSHAEGSSYTATFKHPYLSVVATAGGSARTNDKNAKQDLAQLASRMFFEAQLQTGCQEDFTPPSGPPRVIGE